MISSTQRRALTKSFVLVRFNPNGFNPVISLVWVHMANPAIQARQKKLDKQMRV